MNALSPIRRLLCLALSVLLPVLLLLLPLWPGGARAHEGEERVWRVCLPDLPVPPYLLPGGPTPLGLSELLLIEAGRQAGLKVMLMYYPTKRCRAMLDSQAADAVIAVHLPSNLSQVRLPMKGGVVEASRRVVRLRMVWVKRADSPLDWDGRQLHGRHPGELLVGIRYAARGASEPLAALGFRVDEAAANVEQLLRKLAAQRVDLAVALQEEVDYVQFEATGLPPLLVLPHPLAVHDYHAAVQHGLEPAVQEKVEAWWTAIGRLRDNKPYKPQ